jgi:hypothetical protein
LGCRARTFFFMNLYSEKHSTFGFIFFYQNILVAKFCRKLCSK